MEHLEQYRVQRAPGNVYYMAEFVSEAEEARLWRSVYSAPAHKWTVLSSRRLQNWGGQPHEKGMLPEDMPWWLRAETEKVSSLQVFGPKRSANHVLINEYEPGQGIMAHEDGPLFYPTVSTISIGSHTLLNLYAKADLHDGHAGDTTTDAGGGGGGDGSTSSVMSAPNQSMCLSERFVGSLLLEARSLLLLQGSAYTALLHDICDTRADIVNKARVLNWSMTAIGRHSAILWTKLLVNAPTLVGQTVAKQHRRASVNEETKRTSNENYRDFNVHAAGDQEIGGRLGDTGNKKDQYLTGVKREISGDSDEILTGNSKGCNTRLPEYRGDDTDGTKNLDYVDYKGNKNNDEALDILARYGNLDKELRLATYFSEETVSDKSEGDTCILDTLTRHEEELLDSSFTIEEELASKTVLDPAASGPKHQDSMSNTASILKLAGLLGCSSPYINETGCSPPPSHANTLAGDTHLDTGGVVNHGGDSVSDVEGHTEGAPGSEHPPDDRDCHCDGNSTSSGNNKNNNAVASSSSSSKTNGESNDYSNAISSSNNNKSSLTNGSITSNKTYSSSGHDPVSPLSGYMLDGTRCFVLGRTTRLSFTIRHVPKLLQARLLFGKRR